jgi:hypothetical protein
MGNSNQKPASKVDPAIFDVNVLASLEFSAVNFLKRYGMIIDGKPKHFHGDKDDQNQNMKISKQTRLTYQMKNGGSGEQKTVCFRILNAYTYNGNTKKARVAFYVNEKRKGESIEFENEDGLHKILTDHVQAELPGLEAQGIVSRIELWDTLDRLTTIVMHLHACKQQSSLT